MLARCIPPTFRLLSARRILGALGATLMAAAPAPAHAWDVGTTHLQLSEAALLASSAHRSLMDSSGMRLGLFSRFAVNPDDLNPVERWELEQAILKSPDRAMARPRGGEPLCPPDDKRADNAKCLKRRPWSQDALAWLRLGVLTAARAPHLLAQHMAQPLPGKDNERPSWFRNAQRRYNEAPLAASLTQDDLVRHAGPMDLLRQDHGWSLRELGSTMAASAIAPSPKHRELATAKSMVLWGIALHLLQNQTLPAYARGELAGTFEALSKRPHDRGSALAQWTRGHKDRSQIDELTRSATLPELLSGMQDWSSALSRQSDQPSLPRWVAKHFISPEVFPAPVKLDWDLDPQRAANELLAKQTLALRSAEREGLVLQGWPAATGYLCTASGRMLAAYQRNDQGEVSLREDPAVMAENAAQLLSLAMAASKHLLNRAYALPPEGVSDPTQSPRWRTGWSAPRVVMLQEDAEGQRRVVARWTHKLPDNAQIAAEQRKASAAQGQPLFVVYEGDSRKLPRLLTWRLPSTK